MNAEDTQLKQLHETTFKNKLLTFNSIYKLQLKMHYNKLYLIKKITFCIWPSFDVDVCAWPCCFRKLMTFLLPTNWFIRS